jgi:hypothetical protein
MSQVHHQTLSDGIVENVPCHSILAFGLPENMVVEALLPQIPAPVSTRLRCGSSFEIAHECDQVRLGREARELQVKVIGHEAVGVDIEQMGRALLPKNGEEELHQRGPEKIPSPLGTEGNEIPPLPQIGLTTQADAFAQKMRHGRQEVCGGIIPDVAAGLPRHTNMAA